MESACKPEASAPSTWTLKALNLLLRFEREWSSTWVSDFQLAEELARRVSLSQLSALASELRELSNYLEAAAERSSYSPTDSSSSSPARIPTAAGTPGRADCRVQSPQSAAELSTPSSTPSSASLEQQVGHLRQAVLDTNSALQLQRRLTHEQTDALRQQMAAMMHTHEERLRRLESAIGCACVGGSVPKT